MKQSFLIPFYKQSCQFENALEFNMKPRLLKITGITIIFNYKLKVLEPIYRTYFKRRSLNL